MYNFNFTIQVSLIVGNRSQSNLLNDSVAVVPPQINSSAKRPLQQQLLPSDAVSDFDKDVVFVKSAASKKVKINA